MKTFILVAFFLHTISHVFGRPDYTLNDPKTRFSRSTEGNTNRTYRRYHDTIIFPHEEKVVNRFHGSNFKMPKIKPDSCENGICEDVDDYPYEFIENVLSKSKEFQAYFASQAYYGAIPLTNNISPPEASFIVTDRVNINVQEEESLCKSVVTTKYPQVVTNLNGTNITVVNSEKYQQVVLTETCELDNGTCKFADTFPNNYESSCKQKFINYRLMAFNNTGSFIDLFPIASCCICYVKKKTKNN